jgi:hypothetical protein
MGIVIGCEPCEGRHWESGSLRNALACRGAKAPHTGEPYSEALLLGISGGIAFGYFVFEYKGYLPHVALLTRNTFSPFETILERLAIPHEVRQTTNPEQGQVNLLAALDGGQAAIVWADRFSLPYTGLSRRDDNWGMLPILVHGYEGETFHVADGSRRSFHVSFGDLAQARGRVKQDRFRLITLDPPEPARLPAAVQKGIWQCLTLFTEPPPKGSKDNFGFAAYQRWAKMLGNTRHKQSWERTFAPGARMYQALAGSVAQPGAYGWIMHWGAGPDAERGVYADFLEEAAVILGRPGLREAAGLFRLSAQAWHDLAQGLLPDEVPLLSEARALHDRRHALYVEQGEAARDELAAIQARLGEIERCAAEAFPLTDAEAAALRGRLRQHVLKVHEAEVKAVEALQAAMAG